MEDRRFDEFARVLGTSGTRRAGLRTALGGLLGAGLGAAVLGADADAKRGRDADADAGKRRRKKRCRPACSNGFECVKVGRKHACQCPTGVTCGEACCRIGQVCRDGQCVPEPGPSACIPAGEPCKDTGRICCDGRTCASGQGGEADIACYAPKTGACATSADCVYGTVCEDGRCAGVAPEPPAPPSPPAELAASCDAAAPEPCVTPGAICVAYDDPSAPVGTHCTRTAGADCTDDATCSSYHCAVGNAAAQGAGRAPRSGYAQPAPGRRCCGTAGKTCQSDVDCCFGTSCAGGSCTPCTVGATHVTPNLTRTLNGVPDPSDVAFLADGRMVVVNQGSIFSGARVLAPDGSGGWVVQGSMEAVPPGQQPYSGQMANGVAVGADGKVYITYASPGGATQNLVAVFEESGGTWSRVGQVGAGQLNMPKFSAFGPDGRLYITEGGAQRVSIWRNDGGSWVLDDTFGSRATFGYPAGIVVDPLGTVIVSSDQTDTSVAPLSVWRTVDGTWAQVATLGTFFTSGTIQPTQFENPWGVTLVGNVLFAVDQFQGRVSVWQEIAGAWTFQSTFGTLGGPSNDPTTANLGNPMGLALGPDSLMYVADWGNALVSPWGLTCSA